MQEPKQIITIEGEEFQILPQLTPEQTQQLQEEQRKRLQTFYTESKKYSFQYWYPELQEFTFKSQSFPLSNLEAHLLNLIYQENQQKLNQKVYADAVQKLREKVDNFLKKHFPEGCFFKLSTRSPKDFGWRYQDSKQILRHENLLFDKLSSLKFPFGNNLINEIYRYFLQQSKEKVKITSGKQFIDVFSHSERIQIDLNDLMYLNNKVSRELDNGNMLRSHEVLMNVWGRQWKSFSWMEEFRLFYYKYKATSLTQYDQRCFFSQIQQKKDLIQKKILEFFQTIVPKLKKIELAEGALDLTISIKGDMKVQLIQINVFNENSRASLFSWANQRKKLEEGPFEGRFIREPIDISKWQLTKMMGMMERGIQKIVEPVMQRLGFAKQWKEME